MMMKGGIRILAIEDSPFSRSEKRCRLVGVVGRSDIIEGVLSFYVDVDGYDSAKEIIKHLRASRFIDQVRLLALNGNTVAGMNIIDIAQISKELKIPIIAVTRKKPHPSSLKRAVKAAFKSGYKRKTDMIDRLSKTVTISKGSDYYIQLVGIDAKDSARYIDNSVGLLRLAHIIASGIATGESKGRL